MGALSESITSAAAGGPPAGSPLPAYITAGDHILTRAGGDFPDELVYTGVAGGYQLWIKSPNLLAGPWEWIVCAEGLPVDFAEARYPSRNEAVVALLVALAGLGVPAGEASELVEAAPSFDPRPATPARAACNAASAAGDPGSDDGEVIGLALDLAIAALRKARLRYPQAVNSMHA